MSQWSEGAFEGAPISKECEVIVEREAAMRVGNQYTVEVEPSLGWLAAAVQMPPAF